MLLVLCVSKCQIRSIVQKSLKMELLKIVLCSLCFSLAYCATGTYKAAVVDSSIVSNENKLVSMIYHAAKLDVDILMLPEISAGVEDNIQKIKEAISNAAKEAKIYVATQTVEKSCNDEEIRKNLIVDRNGAIVRKPVSSSDATPAMDTFISDFGVTFGVVMEEDLLRAEHLEGVRNVIAFGPSIDETRFLYAKQFPGSWAFTTRSNLITTSGAYGGPSTKNGGLVVAEMKSDLPDTFTVERVKAFFPTEDMSQYTLEPLHVSAARGYKETVCHDTFCCEFDVKTGTGADIPYSLVAYNGAHDMGEDANGVGVQACAAVACAGHHGSCYTELEKSKTKPVFEKLSISAFFSKNSVQYPLIITSTDASYDDFTFVRANESNHASIELINKDIISFGVVGRVSRDFVTNNCTDEHFNLADIALDNFQEFFDYVWIRLRVIIFIASIYVLEML